MAKSVVPRIILKEIQCRYMLSGGIKLRHFSVTRSNQCSNQDNPSDNAAVSKVSNTETLQNTPRYTASLSERQKKEKRRQYNSLYLQCFNKTRNPRFGGKGRVSDGSGGITIAPKRKVQRIQLPTHYLEVNYRTMKAVVFDNPDFEFLPTQVKKALNNLF